MSSKQIWKPGTLVCPVPPALVSCGTLEKPNALTIAWTGIINSDPAMTYISVRPERYSYQLIKDSGCFVINLPVQKLVRAIDFCGVKSGVDTDKFALCKLTAAASSQISAPIVTESPVNVECEVTQILPLGSHDMFLAKIVAVQVDESLLSPEGKLMLHKAGLVSYAHGEYYSLGEKLGTFGYSVRKKPLSNGKKRGKYSKKEQSKK